MFIRVFALRDADTVTARWVEIFANIWRSLLGTLF